MFKDLFGRASLVRLPGIAVAQIWSELQTRYIRHLRFRRGQNSADADAYRSFGVNDLARINRWQVWSNWRTLPRISDMHLPKMPQKTIDLCAGTGSSSEVLAACLPAGSDVLGLESHPLFVEYALSNASARGNERVTLRFRAQSVLEPFCDMDGRRVPESSIDFVNCSGAVGVHFSPSETCILVSEINRVLRPGGLASIDAGPLGTSKKALVQMFSELNIPCVDTVGALGPLSLFPQLCFRKRMACSTDDGEER